MRIIKLAIISLVFFFLLITGISLFIPSHIRLSKATDIRTSREALRTQLEQPANWQHWYPGADSAGLLTENGKITGIITAGNQELLLQTVSDSAITLLQRPRNVQSGWILYDGHTPGMITVQWYADIHLRWYPWEKFSSLLLERRYGPTMEKGLDNLKKLLETANPPASLK